MNSAACHNLLKVGIFLGGFFALTEVAKKIVPKTKKHLQLDKDDAAKGRSAYARHVACLIATIHGAIATILCTIISVTKGVQYAEPNEEIHNWAVAVSNSHLSLTYDKNSFPPLTLFGTPFTAT